ncbi:hypothetical protein EPH_0020870 [Eimeria praecox]|uniref:Uncharacterized protein n=1 Tax=Eimeria praecox TaxID=51316 RepID=U6H2H1_9EIME|nr:hypothetical protein EPH_0020870 [Eimeria praecox]
MCDSGSSLITSECVESAWAIAAAATAAATAASAKNTHQQQLPVMLLSCNGGLDKALRHAVAHALGLSVATRRAGGDDAAAASFSSFDKHRSVKNSKNGGSSDDRSNNYSSSNRMTVYIHMKGMGMCSWCRLEAAALQTRIIQQQQQQHQQQQQQQREYLLAG